VLFSRAVREDPEFALAHLGVAETAPTETDVQTALDRAVALTSGSMSEGERLLIRAFKASREHDLRAEFEYVRQAAGRYPHDERTQVKLGDFYTRQKNYDEAIRSYEKALTLASDYSAPHQRLGQVYRALGRYDDAEQELSRFIELNPQQAKAYNLHAALLMKQGRFEESIEVYRRALGRDPTDMEAQIGIGNNLLFLDRTDEAVAGFQKVYDESKTDDRSRRALLWIAAAHMHEGTFDKALGPLDQARETTQDAEVLSTLLEITGNVLLENGDPDGAGARFADAVKVAQESNIATRAKWRARARGLYNEARVAVARDDLAAARSKTTEYRGVVGSQWVEGATARFNELQGLILLASGKGDEAADKFRLAGERNPRMLYLMARAYRDIDPDRSREPCREVVDFNEPLFELAYVRAKARRLLDEI
jgi:tetratricopeptide (TPR) repeat protein